MPEWLAIVLIALIAGFVLWVFLSLLIGLMHGDLVDGMVYAFIALVVVALFGGLIAGAIWLVELIWSVVPS